MTYIIYYINPQTLTINIKNFYKKYDQAIKNLRIDVEDFIMTTKNVNKIEFVNKKKEILLKSDGYYLKMSNKYANRISIYEKNSRDIGYIFSNIISNVKKISVFSLLELSSVPDEISIPIQEIKRTFIPKIEAVYMEELKEKLKKKFS